MVTTRSPTGIRLKWAGGVESQHQYPGTWLPSEFPPPRPAPDSSPTASLGAQEDKQKVAKPEEVIGLSSPVSISPLPTLQLVSLLTEGAGVLWGALDAPIWIRLEVETLAAEQFGDDAFELRLWRERHLSLKMTSLFPETFLHLAGSQERRKGE